MCIQCALYISSAFLISQYWINSKSTNIIQKQQHSSHPCSTCGTPHTYSPPGLCLYVRACAKVRWGWTWHWQRTWREWWCYIIYCTNTAANDLHSTCIPTTCACWNTTQLCILCNLLPISTRARVYNEVLRTYVGINYSSFVICLLYYNGSNLCSKRGMYFTCHFTDKMLVHWRYHQQQLT
jgi:hypothetical protein